MQNRSLRNALAISALFSISSTLAFASGSGHQHNDGHSHGHAHDSHDASYGGHKMSHDGESFLKKKKIDGYTVSFHVMEASEKMRHGGSHNFMIKVEKGGKTQDDVVINSKVIHPNGKAESKMLVKMGDWFMNGYDLGHKGKHQLMILFKTADGKKHKAGVYFSS